MLIVAGLGSRFSVEMIFVARREQLGRGGGGGGSAGRARSVCTTPLLHRWADFFKGGGSRTPVRARGVLQASRLRARSRRARPPVLGRQSCGKALPQPPRAQRIPPAQRTSKPVVACSVVPEHR